MLSLGPLAGPTKTLVGQATRDNDSPPSGYQLDLLCKSSFASPNECDQLLDAILRRLDSNSANVKWKTLRVISYLCQHGNAGIRKEFQRKIDRIRICTGFTGPLHPLRGDAPNERVRLAAKEALSALFSTSDPQPHYANPKINHLSGGQSFESSSSDRDGVLGSALKSVLNTATSMVSNASSATGHTSSYRPTTSSYQVTGIGNPNFHRSNSQPSVLEKMKQVFDPRWKSHSVSQPNGYSGLPLGGGPANRGDFDVKPAMLEGGHRRRGHVGGNWAEGDSDVHLQNSGLTQTRPSEKSLSDLDSHLAEQTDAEYGSLETRLVEDLTASGGVTAAPASDQLASLLGVIGKLDQTLIAELLARKLDVNQSWQTQVKALSVIEALLNKDCCDIFNYFTGAPESIIALATSKLRAVRIKADKVYEMLGLSKMSDVNRSQPSGSNTGPQAPDLLQFCSNDRKTVDLLDISMGGDNCTQSAQSQDPLSFLTTEHSRSASSVPSFPFISQCSGQSSSNRNELPFDSERNYFPLSDSITSPQSDASASNSDAFTFLNNSYQDLVHAESRVDPFKLERPAQPVDSSSTSNPVSSFSFVTHSAPEKESKPLDPFANAIKTVRKSETVSRDSFSFVQDMIKSSTSSR